jgi:hypothetical protein
MFLGEFLKEILGSQVLIQVYEYSDLIMNLEIYQNNLAKNNINTLVIMDEFDSIFQKIQ